MNRSGLPSPLQSNTATPPPTAKLASPSYTWSMPEVAVSSTKWGGPRALFGADAQAVSVSHKTTTTAAMARARITDRCNTFARAGLDDPLAHTTREVLAAGETRQHLSRRANECAVARKVAGK